MLKSQKIQICIGEAKQFYINDGSIKEKQW